MATYAFLSPEWIEAARALRAGFAAGAEIPTSTMRMNLTVEEVPYGEGVVEAHVDTTQGLVDIELGHIDPADVKVTLNFGTARAVLIDNDAEIAMAAFMAGKVRIEGDMTKLLAYQSIPPTAAQLEVTAALREITAP